MDDDAKKYIDATNRWVRNQQGLIKQLGISAQYGRDMIEVHTKRLAMDLEDIDIETKAMNEVMEAAKEFCIENGIDPSVLEANKHGI